MRLQRKCFNRTFEKALKKDLPVDYVKDLKKSKGFNVLDSTRPGLNLSEMQTFLQLSNIEDNKDQLTDKRRKWVENGVNKRLNDIRKRDLELSSKILEDNKISYDDLVSQEAKKQLDSMTSSERRKGRHTLDSAKQEIIRNNGSNLEEFVDRKKAATLGKFNSFPEIKDILSAKRDNPYVAKEIPIIEEKTPVIIEEKTPITNSSNSNTHPTSAEKLLEEGKKAPEKKPTVPKKNITSAGKSSSVSTKKGMSKGAKAALIGAGILGAGALGYDLYKIIN